MMKAILLPIMTWAALFTGTVGNKTLDLTWQNETTRLELAGQGLRAKKVAFIRVNVYDAHLYVKDANGFKRTADGALNSLESQSHIAMVMKFHREVTAKQILDSFKDALTANKVKFDAPGIKEFLAVVEAAGSVGKGQTLSVVGLRKDGQEILIYENAKGETAEIKGAVGLLNQVYSIWLGKMGESTMETLKESLLKAP